jgi:adenosylmethionine-8-amino-7-oxononanoate aminotransferase
MKMAQQYWLNRGEPLRSKFVAFKGGYHGDTLGAMAVSDPDAGFNEGFRRLLPEHVIADLPADAESGDALELVLARHADSIAGLIVEPLVQGAGGMRFHEPATLQRLREIADRCGALLIFDEIFTGFGRTGSMFAGEQAGVSADIVTLSKALTGGTLPLAATIASRKVFEAFWSDDPQKALMHGPTYMGNALACAAANASLDLFEREPRLAEVNAISEQMERELEPCRGRPGVKDVRVKGAIGVVELERTADVQTLRAQFVEEGVFIRPFGAIIYLTPAFTIESDELSRLTGAIVKIVGENKGI